jgi:hypothetical protein
MYYDEDDIDEEIDDIEREWNDPESRYYLDNEDARKDINYLISVINYLTRY